MTDRSSPDVPQSPPASRPSPVLIIFLVVPLLGIIAALGLALGESIRAAQSPATPLPVTLAFTSLIDQPAPNFELTALDGSAYRLSSFRGRITFLNFWATWCEPCKRELPALEQFTSEQGSDGPVVLAVNVAETPEQIQTYFDEVGIKDLRVLLDSKLDVYSAYDVQVMPTTYVIDPAGVIRYRHLGEMKAADLNAYISELQATTTSP